MNTRKIVAIVVGCIVGWLVLCVVIIALAFGLGLQLKKAAPAIKERVKANIMKGVPAEGGSSQAMIELSAEENKLLQDEIRLYSQQGAPNFQRLTKYLDLYWLRHKSLPQRNSWVEEANINFPGGQWDSTYFENTGTDFVYQNMNFSEGSYVTLARYNKQGLIYEVHYMIRPSEGKTLNSCEPHDKIGTAFCQALADHNGWESFSHGFGLFKPLP